MRRGPQNSQIWFWQRGFWLENSHWLTDIVAIMDTSKHICMYIVCFVDLMLGHNLGIAYATGWLNNRYERGLVGAFAVGFQLSRTARNHGPVWFLHQVRCFIVKSGSGYTRLNTSDLKEKVGRKPTFGACFPNRGILELTGWIADALTDFSLSGFLSLPLNWIGLTTLVSEMHFIPTVAGQNWTASSITVGPGFIVLVCWGLTNGVAILVGLMATV